ncbi:hypothetical protein PFISCL1PPCAC_19015, partial [Pristionchus fissidentatus]
VADVAVNDIMREFPELRGDTALNWGLKLELTRLAMEKAEEAKGVLAGFPSEFRILERILKKLRVIQKKEVATWSEEDQEVIREVPQADLYLAYFLRIRPITKVVRTNRANYEERKLSKAEIKEEIKAKQQKLIRRWNFDKEIMYEDLIENWKKRGLYDSFVADGIIKEDL